MWQGRKGKFWWGGVRFGKAWQVRRVKVGCVQVWRDAVRPGRYG